MSSGAWVSGFEFGFRVLSFGGVRLLRGEGREVLGRDAQVLELRQLLVRHLPGYLAHKKTPSPRTE